MAGSRLGFFNWAYENSPINFAQLTGWHHPSIPRLKGNPFLGCITQGAKADGSRLNAVAQTSPRGMAYCNYVSRPVLLVTRPEEVAQLLLYNADSLDRGEALAGFASQFGEHNLVTMPSNELWKTKRTALKEKTYTDRSLNLFFNDMLRITDDYIEKLKEEKNVDSLEEYLTQYTMDIAAQTLLGSKPLGDHAKPISEALGESLEVASIPLNTIYAKLANTRIGKYYESWNKQKINAELIAKRKSLHDTVQQHFIEPNQDEKATPNDEALDDIIMSLLAGHETTERLIQFSLLSLLKDKPLLEKVRAEINDNKPLDNVWTPAHLAKLTLLGKVLKETLRLFPPFPFMIRVVTKKMILADIPLCKNKAEYQKAFAARDVCKDIILHPGNTVNIAPWITQRSEKYFTNPLQFNPERHKTGLEDFAAHSSDLSRFPDSFFAMFPFGMGDRDCPGKRFALQEAQLKLMRLVSEFDFEVGNTAHLLETYIRGTLRHKEKVPMEFRPR